MSATSPGCCRSGGRVGMGINVAPFRGLLPTLHTQLSNQNAAAALKMLKTSLPLALPPSLLVHASDQPPAAKKAATSNMPPMPPQALNQLRGDATLGVVVETHTVVVETKEAILAVQVRRV